MPSSLLLLPDEILLQICRDLFTSPKPLILGKVGPTKTSYAEHSITPPPLKDQETAKACLSVTQTCKKLKKIMSPILFSEGIFQIHIEAPSSSWNTIHRSFQEKFLSIYGNKLRNVIVNIQLGNGGMCSNPDWLEANSFPLSLEGGGDYRYTPVEIARFCRKELVKTVRFLRKGRRRKIARLKVLYVESEGFINRVGPGPTEELEGEGGLAGVFRGLKGCVGVVDEADEVWDQGGRSVAECVREEIFGPPVTEG